MKTNLVIMHDQKAVTTSMSIAETFGKRHDNVVRDIETLIAQTGSSKLRNQMFAAGTYKNRGKQYPMYYMNHNGFSLLAFGFSGKDALKFKLDYIEEFNRMEQALKNGTQQRIVNPLQGLGLPNGDIQAVVTFHENPVRILSADVDGRRLVVSRDVNTAMGYQNHRQAVLDRVSASHRYLYQVAPINYRSGRGGLQKAVVLDEIGFGQLIEHSKKPEAQELSNFLFGEAFPRLESLTNVPTVANSVDKQPNAATHPQDPSKLLTLAEIAKDQSNMSVYEDLIQRAMGALN